LLDDLARIAHGVSGRFEFMNDGRYFDQVAFQ